MGGQTTSTTTSKPPAWAEPLFQQSASEAQKIYNSGAGGNPYTGETVAGLSPTQQAGIAGTQGVAEAYNDQGYQSMLHAPTSAAANLSGMASGANLLGNPYFEDALKGQLDKTAAQVQSQFSGAGRYGSAADAGALTNALGNIRSTALSNQYNQDVANQLAANSQIDSANANHLGAINSSLQGQLGANAATTDAGKLEQQYQQNLLNEAQNKFTAEDNQPWTRLGLLQSAASGSAGNYGTSTATQSNPFNPTSLLGAVGSLATKA